VVVEHPSLHRCGSDCARKEARILLRRLVLNNASRDQLAAPQLLLLQVLVGLFVMDIALAWVYSIGTSVPSMLIVAYFAHKMRITYCPRRERSWKPSQPAIPGSKLAIASRQKQCETSLHITGRVVLFTPPGYDIRHCSDSCDTVFIHVFLILAGIQFEINAGALNELLILW
jgi:hypothetical protein